LSTYFYILRKGTKNVNIDGGILMRFIETTGVGCLLTCFGACIAFIAFFSIMFLGGLVTLFNYPPYPESFLIGLVVGPVVVTLMYLVSR
jgi:hypothetical protein